jgi:hypothetical protein
MARGGHGLPKVPLWPVMPYPSTSCRRAIPETALWPFQGWPARRAGSLQSSTPPDTPRRTPMGTGLVHSLPENEFWASDTISVHELEKHLYLEDMERGTRTIVPNSEDALQIMHQQPKIHSQDASAIFPIQKIPFRWNKDFMIIYYRVHDLSHSCKYFVGEFVRCSVITCYNTAWGNCEL